MKTVLALTFLFCLSLFAVGQNVVQVEYFFDTDAGFGKNTLVAVTPSPDGPFSFTIDVSGASAGYHTLYTRTRDSNGSWSHTTMRNVEVFKTTGTGNVTSAEYFFDTDPGVGKAASTTLTTRADGSFAFTIPTNETKPGVGAHVLYVRAKDSPDRNWSLTQWKAVTVVNCSPPEQPAAVASQTVCAGSVVPVSVGAGAPLAGYRWAVPSGWSIVSGQGTPSVMLKTPTVTTATNFTTLTVAAYNACDTSQVRTVSVLVNPLPARPTITSSDTLLTSSSTTGNQWFRNGTAIPGATGQTYRPPAAGQYTVQLTQNGCTGPLSDAHNLIITATEPGNALSRDVLVFPNPISDHITVVNHGSRLLRVRLYSLTGQSLVTVEGIVGTYQINTTSLASGCYVLLVTDEQAAIPRMLKQLLVK